MKKILVAVLICSFVVTLLIHLQDTSTTVEKQIDDNLSLIAEKVWNPQMAMSSNPYDYIEGNQAFSHIIILGEDALPYLHKKLSESAHNGLQEYITAIAIEKITKVELNTKEGFRWETGKEFESQWRNYLMSVPPAVE